MFDETCWDDTTAGYFEDQTVPCGNIGSTTKNCKPALQLGTSALSDSNAVPYGNIYSTIQTQHYQPVLQQSNTSRKHGTIPDTSASSSRPGNTMRGTMQKIPQHYQYQPVLHQSDTSRGRSALPDGDALSCSNIQSTIASIPQYYQPVLQRSCTSKAESFLTESDDSHFETLGNLF